MTPKSHLGSTHGRRYLRCEGVVFGWVQYTFTPTSSWGILAYTQVANLLPVQLDLLGGPGHGVQVLDMPVGRISTAYARTGEGAPRPVLAFLAFAATLGPARRAADVIAARLDAHNPGRRGVASATEDRSGFFRFAQGRASGTGVRGP